MLEKFHTSVWVELFSENYELCFRYKEVKDKIEKMTYEELKLNVDKLATALAALGVKKGDRVALVGFGSFAVSKRAARNGRNPQTGKTIKIAAKKVAKFKAGADLAKTVNK